jgi:hypothetical protein
VFGAHVPDEPVAVDVFVPFVDVGGVGALPVDGPVVGTAEGAGPALEEGTVGKLTEETGGALVEGSRGVVEGWDGRGLAFSGKARASELKASTKTEQKIITGR